MKIIADRNIPFVEGCFSPIAGVEILDGREIAAKAVKDADVLLVRSITNVNEQLLAESNVRFVGSATSGFEHIDTDFLAKNNIGFAYAPGSNSNSVAEYVIAALLEIGKKYNITLEGKSIGVIGVGNIGSRVEGKCKALGMKPFLNDPPLYRKTGDRKYLPLAQLFDCDIITLHTPLTFEGIDKTYHLANEEFFKSLKKGCIFINTARGGVVETEALKSAIKNGVIKAAVLDVWENEPDIDIELLDMIDIGTAHIAGYSLDGKLAGTIMIYKAVCKFFGFKAVKDIAFFLPEPAVPKITIDYNFEDEQQLLQKTVEKVYDIGKDDADLRKILDSHPQQRAEIFDSLRKNYPVRREFQNTEVELHSKNKILADKLNGIGFKVSKRETRQ